MVSTTVKAHPSTPVVAQVLQIAPYNDSQIPQFIDALAVVYRSYPDLNDGGYSGYGSWSVCVSSKHFCVWACHSDCNIQVQSYAPVVSTYTTGYQHAIAVFNKSLSYAQTLFSPVTAQLASYNGTSLYISTSYFEFPSYQSYYATLSGAQSSVGSGAALGSRFLDRAALTGSPSALKTMLNVTAGLPGQYTINSVCIVSGGQVFADASDATSGVNPAWRTAYVHNIVARGWAPGTDAAAQQAIHDDITNTKVGALRTLAPNTGSYMNEGDRLDPLFLQDFYGTHLAKLQAVKRKYDPLSLFYCPTCVGSNQWHEDSVGRLCLNP